MSAARRTSTPLQRSWRGWRWRRRWRQQRQRLRRGQRQQRRRRPRRRRRPVLSVPGSGRWRAGGRREAAAAKRTPARARVGRESGSERALKLAPSGPMGWRDGGRAARLQCTSSAAAAISEAGAGSDPWRQPTARGLPEAPPATRRRGAEARRGERVDSEEVGLHAASRPIERRRSWSQQ